MRDALGRCAHCVIDGYVAAGAVEQTLSQCRYAHIAEVAFTRYSAMGHAHSRAVARCAARASRRLRAGRASDGATNRGA